uniref:Ricin B-type lectin domain-containing protein n=2 Tax=Wuchereria bancrofti TaxID=6293 RepID=A0AAF5PWJ8_WUCBA
MLENLVAWVLNNYVGEYLENLNTDQLSIALLQGQVELENVPLKKSALRKFDIPLKVKSGLLGKLTLSVPLTRLRSEPWVIKMSDLLVLLEPSTSVRYDVANVEIYEQAKKEQQLEDLEKYHKRQLLSYWGLPNPDSASEQNWWGASLVSAIVNNIQLVLTNVHIRYEDDITLSNNTPFACGVRIHNVSMQTTDSHWETGYMQPQDGVNMFKKLEIEGLSVYWNCGQRLTGEIKNHMDLQYMMAPEINKDNVCILQPFSAHLYMERNTNKFPLKTYPYIPRFKFNLCPEKVIIELTKRQLLEMSSLGKEWARFDRSRQHRKWRPLTTVGENAKEWWNFAYNRIQDQERQRKIRHTWSFAYNRAKQLNSYCRAYRRRLLSYLETSAISASGQSNKFNERYETSHFGNAFGQNYNTEHTEEVGTITTSSNLATTASLRRTANSEDLILMKQIERDSNYTYHELQLFRETVYRRILAEKEARLCSENGLQSDDESFENIGFSVLRSDSDADRTTSSNHSHSEEETKNSGGGLYSWLSSWIYGPQKEEAKSEKKDHDESMFDTLSTNEKEGSFSTDFKLLEKQVEDEILDVLNESRDDSTILHRDTLLAEVKLKLERMTIRFIEDFENRKDGSTRVLAMDLWQLVSCVHLSPRRHSTAVSLTVKDLSLQRLCTFPAEDILIDNTQDDEIDRQENESLMFGFAKETTQILFAIGKAGNTSNRNTSECTKSNDLNDALFRLAYHRRAPKMTVTHTLDVKCSELSVLYNEGAFDDLATFFSDKSTIKQDKNLDPILMEVITVIDFVIHCPQIKVELRSKRGNLLDRKKKSATSTPFALGDMRDLVVGITNREQFITMVKIDFGSLEVKDLFEPTSDELLCIRSQTSLKKQMSVSCPSLNVDDLRCSSSLSQRRTRSLSVSSLFTTVDNSRNEGLRSPQESAAFNSTALKDIDVVGTSHFTCLLIGKKHPSFESEYKKVSCLVNMDVPKIEICMNRRSYTLLLDFFGLLEPKAELPEDYIEIQARSSAASTNIALQDLEPYNMKVKFNIGLIQIVMNYPTNKYQLGVIRAEEVFISAETRINDNEVPLEISLSLGNCSLSDNTPFYSELYNERVNLRVLPNKKEEVEQTFHSDGENQNHMLSSRTTLHITKCLCATSAAARGYDASVMLRIPSTVSISYVHTHRYFNALLDFWQHFIELQSIVMRNNISSPNIRMNNGMRSKIQLICEIECPCVIVLPLNQLSNQVLLYETASIRISNRFQLSSLIPKFQDFEITNVFDDDDHDCCIDWMSVVCTETSLYEGVRVSNTKAGVREIPGYERVCCDMFQHFHFLSSRKSVLSRPCDLLIDIFRNLDIFVSHRVPDVVITTSLANLNVKLTTEFYRLLRGFLSMNLGDPLVLASETIPIEVLQKPAEFHAMSSKYASFSFRMTLTNVEFNCFVQCENSQGFVPLAGVKLNSSRISFDVYIDNQSELDLICESTELIDMRFFGVESDDRANVFYSVLFPLPKADSNRSKLMSEAHIVFKCDEPPVITLVLLNARVHLLLDWLNDLKNFFLLHSDFIPPVEDAYRGIAHITKLGIMERDPQIRESVEHTFSLKITLKECDLILLEKPESLHSLALVAHTTAVLNMNDARKLLNVNLEIQRINVDWFMMASESESRCQLTNDFSMTISLSVENDTDIEGQPPKLGLSSIIPIKHQLVAEISDMVARVSYRDLHVVRNVLACSLERLNKSLEKSAVPIHDPHLAERESTSITVFRTIIKGSQISFWLMDDHQGTVFPLIRCKFKKFYLNRYLEKVNGSFTFVADYFNQNVFGWEPLIEDWELKQLSVLTKKNTTVIDVFAGEFSTFNVNITQAFLRQAVRFSLQLSEIRHSLDEDFRGSCVRSRSDHLPYILHNQTGSILRFTTATDEVLEARSMQRKSTAKWYQTAPDASTTFEFPTKRLTIAENSEEIHQLIVRVDGWDEISPVNVDAVGTYFRLARCSTSKAADSNFGINVRLVIVVTMDKNGRKVVTIRSALTVINHLVDPILLILTCGSSKVPETSIIRVDPKKTLHVPLKFASASMAVKPDGWNCSKTHEVKWQEAKSAGERINKLLKFDIFDTCYWMCLSIKREHYPEYEMLSGHTISFSPPLSVLNLLPVDAEFRTFNTKYAVSASKQVQITSVNTAENISFEVSTDRFVSVREVTITKSSLTQKAGDVDRLHIRMKDSKKRYLDMYCSLSIGSSGSVLLALWVPYWIVNKSGIPLIIKQEATNGIAAGQMEEHESAKDRNPLMFSFANDNCPRQCTIRIGQNHTSDQSYKPLFGPKFPLTVGLNSMKLRLVHDQHPTQIYNIGVEVRQGTGRYKDTQVVMLTPRYVLSNQTSFGLSLSHIDRINQPNEHVKVASKCSLIWNENFEDNRMICVKRDDVKYWSCPFRIDLISSFHVTMRDVDETPQFLRVEVILNSAIFYVTFTDVRYYPPPIQLENLSDVPVLYQQKIERSCSHLRTICKARSAVDYAWDDHYAPKLLILQVFENKSNFYDPQKPGMGPPLVYTNDVFIKFAHSFNRKPKDGFTDELELALEVLHKGKVILNKLNPSDSSRNQLWRFTQDGCLENIGMNNRAKMGERYVLDVLDNGGFVLMMLKRNSARDRFQKWQFTSEKQLRCKVEGMFVEARRTEVVLAIPNKKSILNKKGIPLEQIWELQSQLPGSGILDVECFHRGPTLVVRITDRQKSCQTHAMYRSGQLFHLQPPSNGCETNFNNVWNFELNVSMQNGIGLSFINGLHEELIYARFQGIVLHVNRQGPTYQITGSVEVIQADNQLLTTDRWQVLFCQQDMTGTDPGLQESHVSVPALKLEMNWTPLEHYDAFDCFRLKMCDLSVQLDETLLWKIVQFVQKTEAAESMKPNTLLQPPNTELDKLDRVQARRCYFGTFDLEIGAVALSVVTIGISGLPPDLRKLKRQFNVKLVSFENAMISLPPFRQFRYFETFSFLVETLNKFYLEELKNQTFNIIVTMDAFGNPLGLASDLKESFEGLLFEGNLGGFVSGLGYCFTNSLSKVASSMATGVGALTFDERHEMMRRRMLRCQPQADSNTALAHLYCGVKGLGVGVLGGLTAILTNTYNESRKGGLTGAVRGITTGAVDTVTKPVQGIFDLVEGTASAVKEIVGGPSTRKSHFPLHRVRLPRVTMNLQSLLPCYSERLAYAQLELLRISGFATNEMLLDVEMLLDQATIKNRVKQYALVCSEQCYIVRQIDLEPSSVVQRIPYKQLKLIQAVPVSEKNSFFGTIEVVLEVSPGRRQRLPHIWCNRFEVAKRLCEKVGRAKQLYDHGKRTLNTVDDFDIL